MSTYLRPIQERRVLKLCKPNVFQNKNENKKKKERERERESVPINNQHKKKISISALKCTQ